MDWQPLVFSSAICLLAAAFEGLCAGRDPMGQLQRTKQPSWSPPNWVWVVIGLAWYLMCFVAAARLVPLWPTSRIALILLIATMLANGTVNVFQFRLKRLDWAFLYLLPYWVLLAIFMHAVSPLDHITFAMFGAYAVYQLYAAAWAYRLWKLNPPEPANP